MASYVEVFEATIPEAYKNEWLARTFLRMLHKKSLAQNSAGDITFKVSLWDKRDYEFDARKKQAISLFEELMSRNMVSVVFQYDYTEGRAHWDQPEEPSPPDFFEYLKDVPTLVLREVLAMRNE